MSVRTGLGYDIHRLEVASGASIVVSGIQVPCDRQLIAHSDGDVVLHAVVDALLGAVAAGDIGQRFPDTDDRHQGRDSADFVRETLALPELSGWTIVNCDVNVIAQAPRLGPYRLAMRERLAELLAVSLDRVSVKFRTNELCDAVGRQEAIQAQAIVLLERP